ncbi:hypothetical protein GALL_508310 [mine drainage metagenome]|uniref:Uncharacterized protein n=1 Tax=mine drainage metagenome TaxID=410659 RepID=A0A1J5PIH7_9ZZZZ
MVAKIAAQLQVGQVIAVKSIVFGFYIKQMFVKQFAHYPAVAGTVNPYIHQLVIPGGNKAVD